MAGFKMKTRKAAAKRFRKATATGKIIRSKGHHGHFLSKRGQKARKNQGTTMVNDANFNQANALVPALGAKRRRSKSIKAALRRAAAAKASAPKAAPAKAAKPATTKTVKGE
jgi:ribosomal protein L35